MWDLPDTPPVESRFQEQVLEDAVAANLDVPHAGAKTADAEPTRYGASIGCMSKPHDGCWVVSVDCGNEARLEPLEGGAVLVGQWDGICKRSFNWPTVVIDANVEHKIVGMGANNLADLVCERKAVRHRNGAYLSDIASDGIFV